MERCWWKWAWQADEVGARLKEKRSRWFEANKLMGSLDSVNKRISDGKMIRKQDDSVLLQPRGIDPPPLSTKKEDFATCWEESSSKPIVWQLSQWTDDEEKELFDLQNSQSDLE